MEEVPSSLKLTFDDELTGLTEGSGEEGVLSAAQAARLRAALYGDAWIEETQQRGPPHVASYAHQGKGVTQSVKVALVQHGIAVSTDEPPCKQYEALERKVDGLIDTAAALGAKVLCLEELWCAPFFFCLREKHPWTTEFACSVEGRPVEFTRRKAAQHGMSIVCPILERDVVHADTLWNTAVVLGMKGDVIGKHRKNHIPRVGDFNESTYYLEGDTGHPVFEVEGLRFGVNICYGRHHPLNWLMFALNGAQLIFNPCATVAGISRLMWDIEARNAAIANSCYVGGNNRVGIERYASEFTSADGKPAHNTFGPFYGSSHFIGPDGSRTPPLSTRHDGVLVAQIWPEMCQRVRDSWMFPATGRYGEYGRDLMEYARHDFRPNILRDPALS